MKIVPLPGVALEPATTLDLPRRYFSQPYPPREALRWVANNLWGPSRRHAELTPGLPPVTRFAPIEPRLRIAFVGDILPLHQRTFHPAPALRAVLDEADVLVANFEGTLVDGGAPRVFLGQAHGPGVLEFLADLFPPERTLLNIANNHAGDFGWRLFERSCERLADAGFHVFGRVDRPGVAIAEVVIASYTRWSNRPCEYVCRAEPPAGGGAPLRILCPHWGYELEAYPRPGQVADAHALLSRWDVLVGHHSHWPQPVMASSWRGRDRLVAYSLGNFTFGLPFRRHQQGLLLLIDVGIGRDGRWTVGRVRWWRTRTQLLDRRTARLTLAPTPAAL